MPDPVRKLEHTHGHITKLVADLGVLLAPTDHDPGAETWDELAALVGLLHDELLPHFADEEEALFPFIRASVKAQSAAVDRLEAAHDALCELLTAMVRVTDGERRLAAMLPLHRQFGVAYADHSVDELALFDELDSVLGDPERKELSRLLRGLRGGR